MTVLPIFPGSSAIYLLLVGILWGSTNPFIKIGSAGIENVKAPNILMQTFYEFKFLFTRWKYVLPFLLNQSGSVVYFLSLQDTDLSLAVPVANSLTFFFTALAGHFLKETINKETILGMAFVLAGITFCVLDKV